MTARTRFHEVNFDGLIGPSHNYAGLALGNLASTNNAGARSAPRAAALQGLAKMRHMLDLGLHQGVFLPHHRPATPWLRALGFTGSDHAVCAAALAADPALLRNAFSASPMWTANAATVSPASDTSDGRCHLSVANLATMIHRSIEPSETWRQLALAFPDPGRFAVHGPLPAALGDEGAANLLRLAASHGDPGVTLFVHGEALSDAAFPARQHPAASAAIARRHGLDPTATLLVRQHPRAIAAGAFHNDVVAVANETVLFAHELAFAEPGRVRAFLAAMLPEAMMIEAPAARIPLDAAVQSYLFNSQLVTLPGGGMALIIPREAQDHEVVWSWLCEVRDDPANPIHRLDVIDVRESMRNGGGPACLRLRVVVDDAGLAAIDRRFLLDHRRCDRIERIVEAHWPEAIDRADLGSPALWEQCRAARAALLDTLEFRPGEL